MCVVDSADRHTLMEDSRFVTWSCLANFSLDFTTRITNGHTGNTGAGITASKKGLKLSLMTFSFLHVWWVLWAGGCAFVRCQY